MPTGVCTIRRKRLVGPPNSGSSPVRQRSSNVLSSVPGHSPNAREAGAARSVSSASFLDRDEIARSDEPTKCCDVVSNHLNECQQSVPVILHRRATRPPEPPNERG